MNEGETEEDVDVDIEIPAHIASHIMDNSRRRKAELAPNDCRRCKTCASKSVSDEDLVDLSGDRQVNLKQYCNWGLAQVASDKWRSATVLILGRLQIRVLPTLASTLKKHEASLILNRFEFYH